MALVIYYDVLSSISLVLSYIKLCNALESQNLSIVRYNNNPTDKDHVFIRENLSVEEAVDCLVAACFIIISTFTCRRISEVLDLTSNCARPALDGGWEVVFGLRKASPVEALSLIGRPVPDIVQQAIDILIDLRPLGIGAREESLDIEPIFLSNFKIKKGRNRAKKPEANTLYKSLELFADVVQVTPNSKGQRWYIRSHECRRFFAISYFWHEKYAGLPALSWFMGHNDIDATMHYVTEEIIASEMPEEEARFAAIVMHENNERSIPGLNQLANQAREYFHTDNLKVINQSNLEDYLQMRFEQGYRIVKHGLNAEVIYMEEYYGN